MNNPQEAQEQSQETSPQSPSPPQADLPPAKDAGVSLKHKMHAKAELKRAKARELRRQELRKAKVPEEMVEAMLEREEYEALPVDQKISRLEHIVAGMSRQVGKDIHNLEYNDGQIADALDVNLRAVAHMFEKLGISREEQIRFMGEAEKELAAELEAKKEAEKKAAAPPAPPAPTEAAAVETELAKAERPALTEEAPVKHEIPEGATTF